MVLLIDFQGGVMKSTQPRKTKIDKTQAANEEVWDIWLEGMMMLFSLLERSNPSHAARLKNDFDESIRTASELHEQKKEPLWAEVKTKLPNNLWVRLTEKAFAKHSPKPFDDDDRKWFRKRVKRRRRGTNIN
jgi:hypothetical protein